MSKIGNIYKKNRVGIIIGVVIFICFITIGVAAVNFFYSGSENTKYGDRLDDIKDMPIKQERIDKVVSALKEDKDVAEAEIFVEGKIVYAYLTINGGVSLEEAKGKAIVVLDEFKEELDFYDFNFNLEQKSTDDGEGFLISGARNINGSGLTWNNNTIVIPEDEADKE